MKAVLRLGLACLSLACLSPMAGAALAQGHAGAGAASGASTGAAVAGPVGALVGAVAGAAAAHHTGLPAEVRVYVVAQTVAPIAYPDAILVGRPVSDGVVWLDVPNYPGYRWACLNGQRVVVDTDTHTVVAVY